jgi:signal peptidase I
MEELNSELIAESPRISSTRGSALRFFIDVIETLLLSAVLFLGINVVSARIRVEGTSMEPNLHNGEFVFVNKLAYKLGTPTRGDIIVFHYPRNPEQEYIKRVVGLPGEKIEIANGKVFVNNQELEEPYIAASIKYGPGSWIVPEGSLFVLGDNRNNSSDSHRWGTLPMEYVVGRALMVYWPPQQWKLIEQGVYEPQ